jgi:hypothetical protein
MDRAQDPGGGGWVSPDIMDLATFERRAFELWEQIPPRFREGVTQFVVEPGVFRKEEFEGGWCFGTCEPDPLMDLIPGAPVSSIIRLWFGSFVAIEADQGELEWEEELEETIRHELQHHLEWRAGVDHLGDEDDLQDENERRLSGAPFTPWFHRWGTQLGATAWLADDELFLEQEVPEADWARVLREGIEVRWGDLMAVFDGGVDAAECGDLVYVDVGWSLVEEPGATMPWGNVSVVLHRRAAPWWRRALALFRTTR